MHFCTSRQFLHSHYSIFHWSSARTAKNWEFLLAFGFPPSGYLACNPFSYLYSSFTVNTILAFWSNWNDPCGSLKLQLVQRPFPVWAVLFLPEVNVGWEGQGQSWLMLDSSYHKVNNTLSFWVFCRTPELCLQHGKPPVMQDSSWYCSGCAVWLLSWLESTSWSSWSTSWSSLYEPCAQIEIPWFRP